MMVYGVALLSGCLLLGMVIGETLGVARRVNGRVLALLAGVVAVALSFALGPILSKMGKGPASEDQQEQGAAWVW